MNFKRRVAVTWLEKKMDLNLDLTLILTMDLNFAVGKKGIALLEVAVMSKSMSGATLKTTSSLFDYWRHSSR